MQKRHINLGHGETLTRVGEGDDAYWIAPADVRGTQSPQRSVRLSVGKGRIGPVDFADDYSPVGEPNPDGSQEFKSRGAAWSFTLSAHVLQALRKYAGY